MAETIGVRVMTELEVQMFEQINALRAKVAELEALNAEMKYSVNEARRFGEAAAKKYNDLIAIGSVLSCAMCGEKYEDGTPASRDERLRAHIAICAEHPMRQLESALALSREFNRKRGHDDDCQARVCSHCGDNGHHLETNRCMACGQKWQTGPCDCGHDEVVK